MTIMSQVSAEKFSDNARVVFPENIFFDPIDYHSDFNRLRDVPLGLNTFRKYLGIICDSTYFPELRRDRENTRSPYLYFVSPTSAISDLSRRVMDSAAGTHILSDKALSIFARRARVLLKEGKWYKTRSVLRVWSRGGNRRLKIKTIAAYMSLAFRRNLWKGLERRKGPGGVYEYRYLTENEVTETPPVAYYIAGPVNSCSGCQKGNPAEASFCMYCGKGLGPLVRVIIQERVRDLVHPPLPEVSTTDSAGKAMLLDTVKKHVREWVLENLVITVEVEENNYISIVDVKEGGNG